MSTSNLGFRPISDWPGKIRPIRDWTRPFLKKSEIRLVQSRIGLIIPGQSRIGLNPRLAYDIYIYSDSPCSALSKHIKTKYFKSEK